jgi:type III secretory pathway component EscV
VTSRRSITCQRAARGLAVLSFQELAPEAQIRPIARISVGP